MRTIVPGRTMTAILAQLRIEHYSPIDEHVDICYSADEDIYYLHQFPGSRVSTDSYRANPKALVEAYYADEIEWQDND